MHKSLKRCSCILLVLLSMNLSSSYHIIDIYVQGQWKLSKTIRDHGYMPCNLFWNWTYRRKRDRILFRYCYFSSRSLMFCLLSIMHCLCTWVMEIIISWLVGNTRYRQVHVASIIFRNGLLYFLASTNLQSFASTQGICSDERVKIYSICNNQIIQDAEHVLSS